MIAMAKHDARVIARALTRYVESGKCAEELITSPEHAEALAAIYEGQSE